MNDSRRIQQTLSYIIGSVLIDALALLFSIVYLLFYSWQMALVASCCIPFFALLVILYNQRIIKGQRNVMSSNAATEGLLIDFMVTHRMYLTEISNKTYSFLNGTV